VTSSSSSPSPSRKLRCFLAWVRITWGEAHELVALREQMGVLAQRLIATEADRDRLLGVQVRLKGELEAVRKRLQKRVVDAGRAHHPSLSSEWMHRDDVEALLSTAQQIERLDEAPSREVEDG